MAEDRTARGGFLSAMLREADEEREREARASLQEIAGFVSESIIDEKRAKLDDEQRATLGDARATAAGIAARVEGIFAEIDAGAVRAEIVYLACDALLYGFVLGSFSTPLDATVGLLEAAKQRRRGLKGADQNKKGAEDWQGKARAILAEIDPKKPATEKRDILIKRWPAKYGEPFPRSPDTLLDFVRCEQKKK